MIKIFSGVIAAALLAAAASTHAQDKIEGKVVSTKLTACTFKPGGCEGTIVLETAAPADKVTIKVPLGTMIKKGEEIVYLPALRGRTVAVTHAIEKGEKIARSIDVK